MYTIYIYTKKKKRKESRSRRRLRRKALETTMTDISRESGMIDDALPCSALIAGIAALCSDLYTPLGSLAGYINYSRYCSEPANLPHGPSIQM